MPTERPAEPAPVQALITQLDLTAHVEGGYYRRTYASDTQPRVKAPGGERYAMTSIFYLLTAASPIGHFHLNRSDIVHYYHLGDPLRYTLINPDGSLRQVVMGADLSAGQVLQLTVPGGTWKASELLPGSLGYGLISQVVSPGFDYSDMQMGERAALEARFGQHQVWIRRLTREP